MTSEMKRGRSARKDAFIGVRVTTADRERFDRLSEQLGNENLSPIIRLLLRNAMDQVERRMTESPHGSLSLLA